MGLGLADELVDAIIGGVGILGGGLEVTVLVLVAIMGASASSEEASGSPYSYSFFSSMLPASSPTASPAPRRSVMT